MIDHVVLYLYYKRCRTTLDHYQLLCLNEGPNRVVPIDVSGNPGAIDLGLYASENRWEGPDAAVYRWARSPEFVPAARYVIAEWDVRALMPLRAWYGDHWDADAVAVSAHPLTAANRGSWRWWDHVPRLPDEIRPHAHALCPFGLVLMSRRALLGVVARDPAPGIFCELRLASYLAAAGYPPISKGRGPGDVWCGGVVAGTGQGIWHPVKTLTP